MAELTQEQLDFLFRQNIPLDVVGDASGYSKSEYHERMRAENRYFVYGADPCKDGHTLKTRNGRNCIQCNTASIAFQMRYVNSGYLYIAGSKMLQVVKVGTSKDPADRLYIASLSGHEYAGASDWKLLFYVHTGRAGEIENKVHQILSQHQIQIEFTRNYNLQVAKECFACNFSIARAAINTENAKFWQERNQVLREYEFY